MLHMLIRPLLIYKHTMSAWVANNASHDLYLRRMPPSKLPYLSFVIEPDLLKRIDDFRFKHRFATRAAAIKWLLDWALAQKPQVPKED